MYNALTLYTASPHLSDASMKERGLKELKGVSVRTKQLA